MEIIALVVIAGAAYLVFLGVKFSSFRSKLMNEFGRQGVAYDDADNIYFQRRDDINNWHHDGVHISEVVQRCLGQTTDDGISRPAPTSRQHSPSASGEVPSPHTESRVQATEQSEKSAAIIQFVASTLGIQQMLMLDENERLPQRALDNWSLGYVAGTADAVLQKNGFEPDVEGMAVITLIFMEVFGQEAGPSLFGDFMRLQDSGDVDVEDGMMSGGKEVYAWMADSNKPPMGWAAHVHDL